MSENSNIIEEQFEGTHTNIKIIYELYKQRIISELWKSSIFLSVEEAQKFPELNPELFCLKGFYKDLYYNEERIYPPIIVNFKNGTKTETHQIFTKKYFEKIYKQFGFSNPLLDNNYFYQEFDIDNYQLFDSMETNYKIQEIVEEDYETLYKQVFNETKIGKEILAKELTFNFKYYIKSPSQEHKIKFILSEERIKTMKSFLSNKEKIYAISGPYGIGKTISLILLCYSKEKKFCYLNLRALNDNKNNIQIWKYKLFLTELYSIFKEDKDKKHFNELKKDIVKVKTYWEAIIQSIKFCINNEIKAVFILDQYKEKIDKDFTHLKKIKENILNDNLNNIMIIISSSINNKDLREFIIRKYVNKESILNLTLNYHYHINIFRLEYISGLINQLSDKKKDIFIKNFGNIPSYFYKILECKDDSLNQLISNIKASIINQINTFFDDNNISYENLCYLVEKYLKIDREGEGDSLEGKSFFDDKEIENLIKLIPIKFFELEIKNNSINKIKFYFPLAKSCFLEAIFTKIFILLKNPKINFPERILGDLLETFVTENIKDMPNEKIDQICFTNKLWNMEYIKGLTLSKVKIDNILIIQQNEYAEKVDLGILLKGETLILYQIKKALTKPTKNFVSMKDIRCNQKNLENTFLKHFECNIKNIYLVYITGIYFTNRIYNEYHTWTKKESDFNILKGICYDDNIPLVYFDVLEKKFLLEDSDNFINTSLTGKDSTLFHSDYNHISVLDYDAQIKQNFEDLKNDVSQNINDSFMNFSIDKRGIGLIERNMIENKIDRELDMEKCISISNPNASFLMRKNSNIVSYFKINQKNYFSYYDEEKNKIIINRIESGTVRETKMFRINQLKVLYLKKKRNNSIKTSKKDKKENKKRSNSINMINTNKK